MIEELVQLIPSELLDRSGAVFNTGRHAFTAPAPLYILGLNPGGDPATHRHETVRTHTRAALEKPADWAAYRDDSWDGHPPGTAGMQPHVLHVLRQLDLSPHEVPMSNLIFERTGSEDDLEGRATELAKACWPFHAAAIDRLKVKTILCLGGFVGGWVRKMLCANTLLDEFVEQNNRRWRTRAHAARDGLIVITASHPARAHWRAPETDPSQLIKRVLTSPRSPLAVFPVTGNRPAIMMDRLVKEDLRATTSRSKHLIELFESALLSEHFTPSELLEPEYDEFTKLKVLKNGLGILSFELYTHQRKGETLRVHHSRNTDPVFRQRLGLIPGASLSPSVGVNFSGDLLEAARRICEEVVRWKSGLAHDVSQGTPGRHGDGQRPSGPD